MSQLIFLPIPPFGWTANIPAGHPRLWLTGSRLATAQAWLLANPFVPSGSDYLSKAFIYACNGDAGYGADARDYAVNFVLDGAYPLVGGQTPVSSALYTEVASDSARWDAEIVMLCFDWTYDLWSAPQIADFIAKWNAWLTTLQGKAWGGVGVDMGLNNYYWGYLRDMLEYGIVAWNEPGAAAVTNIDRAITSRYGNDFIPMVNIGAPAGGLGGVAYEGSEYGKYVLGYPVIPFTQVGIYGRSPTLYDQNAWWKQAVMWMCYTTMPRLTLSRSGSVNGWEVWHFGDDENWMSGNSANPPSNHEYSSFMAEMATLYPSINIGQYAQQWINMIGAPLLYFNYFKPFIPNGTARAFTNLPLDYWASGVQYLYTRNAWGQSATNVILQCGEATGAPSEAAGHNQLDNGSFQMWRGDGTEARWLTRNDVSYIREIYGWPSSGAGPIDGNLPPAYNSLLFHGRGEVVIQYQNGPPLVGRMESQTDYAYAEVNMTPALRADTRPQVDNFYAKTQVREFVFVKALETLVVFDRIEASSDLIPATTVEMTQLVHFEHAPTISGQTATMTIGTHAIKVTSVLPAGTTLTSIDELVPGPTGESNGDPVGQLRLQIETVGSAQQHMLMVLQARAASGTNLTIAIADHTTYWQLDLTHATLGGATIIFFKGMASTGGQVGYSASGLPAAISRRNLLTAVEPMTVTDAGPVWTPSAWSDFGSLIGHTGATGTQNPPIVFDSDFSHIFVSDRVGVSKASMANPTSWTYMDWLSTNPNSNKISSIAVNALGNPLVCDQPRPTRIGAAVWNGSAFVTATFTPALASSVILAGFAVDPNTGYIYTTGDAVVYRSTDNGFTYNQISNLGVVGWNYGCTLMPWGEIIIGGETIHFFSSLDGGVTFTALPDFPRSGNRYASSPTKDGEILLSDASDNNGDMYFSTYTTANALANSIFPLPQFMDPNAQHLAYSAYSGENFVATFNRLNSNHLILLRWNGSSWDDIAALAGGPDQTMLVGSIGSDGTNIYTSTSTGQVKKWTPCAAYPISVSLGPTLAVSVNVPTVLSTAAVSPAGSYTYAWSARGNAYVSFNNAALLHPTVTINATGYYALTLKATSGGNTAGMTFIVHVT